MTLFVEQTEYIGIFGQDAGVRVVVHPQDIAPFPEDTAIKASTGRLTAVAVRKVNGIKRKAVNSLTCDFH